jgi:hypothetical protein
MQPIISGLSCVFWPGRQAALHSGQLGFAVMVQKKIGQVLTHGCMIISWSHLSDLCHLCDIMRYLVIPTHLSGWKEQNIMECRVERMHLRDVLKWLSLSVMENDVSTIGKLLSSTWYHGCNLSSDCGKIVSMTISARIIMKSNPTLMF